MSLLQIVVLALVQGITEFLPISSSGHLVLVPIFADWPDQGLLVDVAVHVGTLGAVVLYLWRDCWGMAVGIVRTATGRRDPYAKLFWYLVAATIPVIAAGLAMKMLLGDDTFRSVAVIGWTMLGWGIVLGIADKLCMTVKRIEHMPLRDAVIIGLSQIIALIPGTSRSGITMTVARVLGYERAEAARFSMLLSIPTIVGAGTLAGLDLWKAGDAALTADVGLAIGLSFVSALIAIVVMMNWLKRASFTPFVWYRVILGIVLLVLVYQGIV